MGLAGLLKAGWRNLVTSSRMDRMGLLAMGRTAESSNGGMHLFIGGTYLIFNWRKLCKSLLMEEPILSLNKISPLIPLKVY